MLCREESGQHGFISITRRTSLEQLKISLCAWNEWRAKLPSSLKQTTTNSTSLRLSFSHRAATLVSTAVELLMTCPSWWSNGDDVTMQLLASLYAKDRLSVSKSLFFVISRGCFAFGNSLSKACTFACDLSVSTTHYKQYTTQANNTFAHSPSLNMYFIVISLLDISLRLWSV